MHTEILGVSPVACVDLTRVDHLHITGMELRRPISDGEAQAAFINIDQLHFLMPVRLSPAPVHRTVAQRDFCREDAVILDRFVFKH